jgi:hypothetical protein
MASKGTVKNAARTGWMTIGVLLFELIKAIVDVASKH